jgi:hypothetical protein
MAIVLKKEGYMAQTNRQILEEIQAGMKKLLKGAANPFPGAGTNPTKPAEDPNYPGPNQVIPPGESKPGKYFFPSGTRPDGGQWKSIEQWLKWRELNPGWAPKCNEN